MMRPPPRENVMDTDAESGPESGPKSSPEIDADRAAALARRPLLLAPDNFTPPTRTPWGGRRILDLKRGVELDESARDASVVGESWEFSVDPAFPSEVIVDDDRISLPALIDANPAAIVGPSAERYGGSTPMLVKLLDAADELSVQVHPSDDYEALAPHESGKPECWYIIGAENGAGLYLGLAEGVTRERLESALRAGDDIREMLEFTEVWPGDTFVIEPGTVHAIGRGVTLVEPQLVIPGCTGKTYRFWDWNRCYDPEGNRVGPDVPDGRPREIHLDDSLAVTRWDAPRGRAFVETTRRQPTMLRLSGNVRHERLCRLGEMSVERLTGGGTIQLRPAGTLIALVATRGKLQLATSSMGEPLVVPAGTSCMIPAAAPVVDLVLDVDSEAILTRIERR